MMKIFYLDVSFFGFAVMSYAKSTSGLLFVFRSKFVHLYVCSFVGLYRPENGHSIQSHISTYACHLFAYIKIDLPFSQFRVRSHRIFFHPSSNRRFNVVNGIEISSYFNHVQCGEDSHKCLSCTIEMKSRCRFRQVDFRHSKQIGDGIELTKSLSRFTLISKWNRLIESNDSLMYQMGLRRRLCVHCFTFLCSLELYMRQTSE